VCIVNAIIFFDFRVAVAIHLSHPRIAVLESGAIWGVRKYFL